MTQPNYLADELRRIAKLRPTEIYNELIVLAERVETLGAEPATAELDAIHAGLEPEQECRADALSAAARLLAGTTAGMTLAGVEASRETIARLWVELAQYGEAWISTGGACPCTVVDDPECPLHGDGSRP